MPTTTTTTTTHSPSPPPPPTALTPGYLATRLSTLYASTLAHTLRACSYANFAACFPTPAARRPLVLRGLWQQVVGKIDDRARAEFDGILGERDVVDGLNRLEGVLEGGRGRREREREAGEGDGERERGGGRGVVPHLLPPLDLYNAHLAPQLAPLHADLDERLRSTRTRNEELVGLIRKQREEVERLVGGLEAVVGDLEGANGAVGEVVGSVRAEGARL
ncbi:hypothetical protein MMC11_005933 [Xylographa trunciseda]|nr:hypothetical protein [Xylographa trunciseda]